MDEERSGGRRSGDRISDRDFFLAVLAERKETRIARDKQLDERFDTQTQAIQTASDSLNKTLQGFPETYAKREDTERLREDLVAIRTDHVQRREFDSVEKILNEAAGRRTAFTASIAIIITLITVALGLMWANQLTHSDVQQEIRDHSPSLQNEAVIQAKIESLRLKVAELEAIEKGEKNHNLK